MARGGYRLKKPVNSRPDANGHITPRVAVSLDAYALCIEAFACFQSGVEGSQKTFVDLAAQAAATSPDYAEARAVHALALMKRHIFWSEGEKCLEHALQDCTEALRIDPKLANAHLTDAAIRITTGATQRGIRSLETALSLAPEDAGLHLEAAILLMSMSENRLAGALATKSAALAPHEYGAELLASRLFRYSDPMRGQVLAQSALRKVRTELEITPHSMRALYALGPLLAQVGDRRGALAALEGIAHHNSPLEYYRAIGFAQIGDTSSALERLEFLGLRGWRHGCMLDTDQGFHPIQEDPRFSRFKTELLAA